MDYYRWWGSGRVGFSPLGREDVRLVPVLSGAGWGVGGGELGVTWRVGGGEVESWGCSLTARLK